MNRFSTADREAVIYLLSKSDDELFAQLGSAARGDRRGAFPPEFSKLVSEGKQWFAERKETICSHVCKSDAVRTLVDDGDRTHLVLTLTGILGHAVPPVAILCVAVLISRLGVKKLCQSYWKASP